MFRNIYLVLLASSCLGACATTVAPAPVQNAMQPLNARQPQVAVPPQNAMRLSSTASPPVGFLEFCVREPSECPASSSTSPTPQAMLQNYWKAAFNTAGMSRAPASVQPSAILPPAATMAAAADVSLAATANASLLSWPSRQEQSPRQPEAAMFERPSSAQSLLVRGVDESRDRLGRGSETLLVLASVSSDLKSGAAFPGATYLPNAAPLSDAYLPRPAAPARSEANGQPQASAKIEDSAEADAPTPLVWEDKKSTVADVNRYVNGAIRQRDDIAIYGRADYWALPLESGSARPEGDCEDYVLEKRRALIRAGLSSRDLSIAIVQTPFGETHAVLLVSTDHGEMVLDNLRPEVLPWQKAGYQWRQRQVNGSTDLWANVEDNHKSGHFAR